MKNNLEKIMKINKKCGGNPKWFPRKDVCQYHSNYEFIKCEQYIDNHCYHNRGLINVEMYKKK